MERTIRVHPVPDLVAPDDLAGRTVLVIDLLRASTTICYALAGGARELAPYVDVDEVRRAAEEARRRGEAVICGGERGGTRIDGFDLGNSPREYTPQAVAGKRVLFTTSNGTKALHHCRLAERVYVACLANLTATERVVADATAVDILCAGSHGRIAREDVIAAGAYAARLSRDAESGLNDSALLALDAWRAANGGLALDRPELTPAVAASLAEGEHGRHLISLGFQEDLSVCAAVDALDLAAVFDSSSGSISALRCGGH